MSAFFTALSSHWLCTAYLWHCLLLIGWQLQNGCSFALLTWVRCWECAALLCSFVPQLCCCAALLCCYAALLYFLWFSMLRYTSHLQAIIFLLPIEWLLMPNARLGQGSQCSKAVCCCCCAAAALLLLRSALSELAISKCAESDDDALWWWWLRSSRYMFSIECISIILE